VALRAQADGGEFSAYPVDVADFDSCKECVARIAQEVGRIDILVNNAGITRDTLDAKILPQIPLSRLGKPDTQKTLSDALAGKWMMPCSRSSKPTRWHCRN
jgi:NAD(P)-dependent dehydrogenase (short-subunit alcohol dehydrogenase family)